jgi:hypothetical protein
MTSATSPTRPFHTDAPKRRGAAADHADHRRALAEAARDATFSFLGRFEVCGVGMTHTPRPRIVFLLRRESPNARQALDAWATERGMPIEILLAPSGP